MYKTEESSLVEFIQDHLIQAQLWGTIQTSQHVLNSLYLHGEVEEGI